MTDEDGLVWDAELAAELVGKIVIVGLTRLGPDGQVSSREQFFGIVEGAHPKSGICLGLAGIRAGEDYWLPPDTRSYERAAPGAYRLKATGEEVIDPDYLSTWTIQPPSE